MNLQATLVPASGCLDLAFSRSGEGAAAEVAVRWGITLVERLQCRGSAFEYKLSAARFYNMRVPAAVLVREYGFARSTVKRYGEALRSGDAERVRRVFSGQGGPRTVTVQIDAYVRGRYASLRQTARNYNVSIREEVQERWGTPVSCERLRRIFRDEDRIRGWNRRRRRGCEGGLGEKAGANGCESPSGTSPAARPSRNRSLRRGTLPFSGQEVAECPGFLHHAGMTLLYPWLESVLAGWPDNPSLVRQLFAQVLCGSVNHEQTKGMHMPSLKVLCGPTVRSPWYLRQLTDRLATPRNTAEVLRRNLGLLGEPCSDRYLFDPHVERYTGDRPVLKLWIGSDHRVDKGLIQDLDIAHTVRDRQVESQAHKELTGRRDDLEEKLGRKLVRQRRARKAGAADPDKLRQERDRLRAKRDEMTARYRAKLAEGTLDDRAQVRALLQEAGRLQADHKQLKARERRAQKMVELHAQIDELTIRLEAVEGDLSAAPRQESRLEQLIAAGQAKLDTRRKAFMDAIRITCCNIFMGCLDVFRTFYDNRRDDHDLLRALTRAPGFVALRHGTVCITLVPELAVQPKAFAAMRRFCEDVSAIVNRTWPGRASPISITVAETPPARALGPPPGGP